MGADCIHSVYSGKSASHCGLQYAGWIVPVGKSGIPTPSSLKYLTVSLWSWLGDTPPVFDAAQKAVDRGRVVLAITDNQLSPVVGLARHVLYVQEARPGHFRSQVPAIVVCQAVIVSLGRRVG